MQKQKHLDIFNKRAADYEGYSDWCRNDELYELCVEPLLDMLHSVKCLDLGGGSGWIARKNAAETGRDWTVFDISPEMGRYIQPPVTFVLGDAHNLPFHESEFGHVVLRSVLQFVDADAVLRQVLKVITPRGHVVIVQKVKDHQGEAPAWHKELHFLRNPTSPQDWLTERLEGTIRSAGLRLMATRFVKERRVVDFERWLSKDGTIVGDKLEQIRHLITNPPASVSRSTNQVIQNGKLMFDRTWAVCYARKETTHSPLTPVVFSMIVEREVNAEKSVLLQRRKKRYEEFKYYGSWEVPQGKSEKGSLGMETVAKELEEETGLRLLSVSDLNPITTAQDRTFGDQTETIYPLVCVRTTHGTDFLAVAIVVTATGEPRSVDLDREYRWVPISELRNLLENEIVYPLNRPMIEVYLSAIDS